MKTKTSIPEKLKKQISKNSKAIFQNPSPLTRKHFTMKTAGIILLAMLSIQSLLFAQNKGGASNESGMVRIPAGAYQPFLKGKGQPETVKIKSFLMDVHAVTNADFLAFVKANPQWARSKVSRLFADQNYLSHWAGDFTIGNSAIDNSPVVNISWFAAEAFAKWKGKRLPTLQEWEYAAQANPVNLKKGEKLTTVILDWYSHPSKPVLPNVETTFKNVYGVYDLHGLVWEWVYDFNSIITGGDSRAGGTLDPNFFCAAGSLNAVNKEDYASFMRFAFRESLKASYTIRNLGFRCVKDIR